MALPIELKSTIIRVSWQCKKGHPVNWIIISNIEHYEIGSATDANGYSYCTFYGTKVRDNLCPCYSKIVDQPSDGTYCFSDTVTIEELTQESLAKYIVDIF